MDDAEVQELKFSNKWVRNFLLRCKMYRRKITKEDKNVPSPEEIQRVLEIGQQLYTNNEHRPETCYNFDETAVTYAIGPTHIFCPRDQDRATHTGVSDSKVRITATIAVSSEGSFAPTMFIIKHSVSSEKKPDQTKMTVIPKLFKKEGFTIDDGWILKTWQKELTIKAKTDVHKVLYLIHSRTGHVITSQVKAWNDTVRMCMWFELIVLPIRIRLGKMLIWCDNCGSHLTQAVKDIIGECNVDVAFLPKNMTAELQVLDLVVNGPLKAHIRNKRALRLYNSFQEFKTNIEHNNNVKFTAPKPSMTEGIKDLILLFEEQFSEVKFKNCINKTFISTGTLPITTTTDDTDLPAFVTFKRESACGTMLVVPKGTLDLSTLIPNSINEDNAVETEIVEERAVESAIFHFYSSNDVDFHDSLSDSEE